MGAFDQLALRGPGVIAKGMAGQRAGEDRRRKQEMENERRQQDIEQSALERLLLQENINTAPTRRRLLEAQARDEEAAAAGTGRYAPRAPDPVRGITSTLVRGGRRKEVLFDPTNGKEIRELGDAPQPAPSGGGGNDGLKFTEIARLRGEFQKHEAPYRLSRTAMKQMEELANDATGASDINLLIAAAKVADPESVVREGEVAIQRTAASLADRLGIKIANLQRGDILSPEQRQKLLQAMQSRMGPLRQEYETRREQYDRLTKGFGGDPYQTIGDDPDTPKPKKPPVAKKGAYVNRFGLEP